MSPAGRLALPARTNVSWERRWISPLLLWRQLLPTFRARMRGVLLELVPISAHHRSDQGPGGSAELSLWALLGDLKGDVSGHDGLADLHRSLEPGAESRKESPLSRSLWKGLEVIVRDSEREAKALKDIYFGVEKRYVGVGGLDARLGAILIGAEGSSAVSGGYHSPALAWACRRMLPHLFRGRVGTALGNALGAWLRHAEQEIGAVPLQMGFFPSEASMVRAVLRLDSDGSKGFEQLRSLLRSAPGGCDSEAFLQRARELLSAGLSPAGLSLDLVFSNISDREYKPLSSKAAATSTVDKEVLLTLGSRCGLELLPSAAALRASLQDLSAHGGEALSPVASESLFHLVEEKHSDFSFRSIQLVLQSAGTTRE
ncbi:unnamed protein product, partial [Polarella glacialis]